MNQWTGNCRESDRALTDYIDDMLDQSGGPEGQEKWQIFDAGALRIAVPGSRIEAVPASGPHIKLRDAEQDRSWYRPARADGRDLVVVQLEHLVLPDHAHAETVRLPPDPADLWFLDRPGIAVLGCASAKAEQIPDEEILWCGPVRKRQWLAGVSRERNCVFIDPDGLVSLIEKTRN